MKTILRIVIILLSLTNVTKAQWQLTGNTPASGNFLGSTNTTPLELKTTATGANAQPINLYTDNTLRGIFTSGTFLSNGTYTGDGLRMVDPGGGPGNLDLFTSTSNTTHIQFGVSGNIDGQDDLFKVTGHLGGLWLNADAGGSPTANIYFNLDGTEYGRIQNSYTTPGYWGIGTGFSSISPLRRLEIVDGSNPQLRLTYTQNSNVNEGLHTDFQTTSDGDLYITPINSSVGTLTYSQYETMRVDFPVIPGSSPKFNPNDALDINGQELIKTVNNDNTQNHVLVWVPPLTGGASSINDGRVMWRDANTLVGAQNGTRIEPTSGKVELGFNPLLYDTYIPFGGHSLAFDPANEGGNVGIGTWGGGQNRFSVYNPINVNAACGIHVLSNNGDVVNFGIFSIANSSHADNWAGYYVTQGNGTGEDNYGINIQSTGITGTKSNTGLNAFAGGATTNIGVVGSGSTYGGYFNGPLACTGTFSPGSDSILKINVQSFTGDSALIYLRNLKPKTYEFDNETYSYMNLPENWQYGFVAQDVNRVLPNLVTHNKVPPQYDSALTLLNDTISYLGLNYIGIIPILVAGEKQLDSIQHALSSNIDNGLSVDTTAHMLQWGGSVLKHNTEIPMVDTTGGLDSVRNIYFTGQNHILGTDGGNIGIGYNYGDYIGSRLGVLDSASGYGFTSAGSFHITGSASSIPFFTGVIGIADVNGSQNIGGSFIASTGSINTGVEGSAGAGDGYSSNVGIEGFAGGGYGIAVEGLANATATNYGSYLQAWGGSTSNIGLYSVVYPNDGASNIAVYGDIGSSGPTAPDYAGYFNGDVYTTGSYLPSDEKLKTNIQQLTGATALKAIDALQPKTYKYNAEQFPTMALSTDQQFGLISEDVEKVLPTLVKDSKTPPKVDSTGKIINPSIEFKALNYTGLVPILIAATKQLDSTNQAQQTKIDSLMAQLAKMNTAIQQLQNCCQQNTGSSQSGNREEVTLSNTSAIILDQNAPNPFAEQTTITYTIPESVSNAQIIFSDINGQVIKTMQIQTRGSGSLLVYASNLSSGIYIYSLIADGKLIDTKKMTVQK